ncbi:MAG TPA: permease [Nevskiaceae bacterium]|nr:permease [Nevskiaceae bacterium]
MFSTTLGKAKGWLVPAVGILIVCNLFTIRAFTAQAGVGELPKRLQDFLTLTTSVIVESLPFVILGIVLSAVVQLWLPESFIANRLPKRPLLRRACISFLGVALPVCECGNVPLARGLMVRGFSVPESLTFLLAAPILNPITIITTHQAFGADNSILAARLIGGFAIANIVGWLFSKHPHPEDILNPKFAATCNVPDKHNHTTVGRRRQSLELFVRETSNIMPALFIGAAVAGLVQTLVPREVLMTLGSNPVWSIAAMMALAFIVSICSNVDAFFALAFNSTFTAGSLVSFLVFGPVIDIKMLSLMRTTYKVGALVQIAVIVALISALLGLVVNYAF